MNVQIKCFLFDIDEVIIRQKTFYSDFLEKSGYKNAGSIISKYYYGNYDNECVYGLKDPLVEIKPFLDDFKWEYSARDYFENDFNYQKKYIDLDLLGRILKLKSAGYACMLATDQDKVRMDYILENYGFNKIFDHWFVSSYLNARKRDNRFWELLIKKVVEYSLIPDEILFIDDRSENIELANKHGIKTFHVSNEDAIKVLNHHIDSYLVK